MVCVLGFEGQFIGTAEDLERLLSRDRLDVFMLSRVETMSAEAIDLQVPLPVSSMIQNLQRH